MVVMGMRAKPRKRPNPFLYAIDLYRSLSLLFQKDFVVTESGSRMVLPAGATIVPLKVREPFRFFRRTLVLRWWRSSSDAELLDGLVVEDGNYKVAKTRFSAFFATNLHSLLQRCGIKDLVVAGKPPIPQIKPT
ncbi:uncharacterized protein LOC135618084 [Musa acuminata AAA Group]|uniref:uncharacterized protein LOC135618084 n=1 Tax=Musa acuminata AAA Group TaxID=214697 RepID=UPI0031D6D460